MAQGGLVDLTRIFANAPVGQWRHVKVPLQCFAAAGARLEAVMQPFEISSNAPFGLSVANIALETGADALTSCTP